MTRVLVTFAPEAGAREALASVLGTGVDLTYLPDLEVSVRAPALSSADAVLVWRLGAELSGAGEFELLATAGLIQTISAGVDHLPLERIPADVPVASNAGAFSAPIAEYVLAQALALIKRLPQNYAEMRHGQFRHGVPTRTLAGSTVGILGFGGIGRACAEVFHTLGIRVHVISRTKHTGGLANWSGTLDDLDALLRAVDILVVSLPLTHSTRGLIGRRELALMKPDAILINVARAAIIDEDALYQHLAAQPLFSAGLDVWWGEPPTPDAFHPRLPLLELPNVFGSPHNSGITTTSLGAALGHAAENIARSLRGERPHGLIRREEYE